MLRSVPLDGVFACHARRLGSALRGHPQSVTPHPTVSLTQSLPSSSDKATCGTGTAHRRRSRRYGPAGAPAPLLHGDAR